MAVIFLARRLDESLQSTSHSRRGGGYFMRWLLAILTGLWVSDGPQADAPKVFPPYTKPTLIAHRGASWDAPEHTLAAYELALKYGADFVEPDLQMTKDGVLVCLHDTTLERTTNIAKVFPDRATVVDGKKTWPVVEFTLAEIRTLDAGSWKGPQFVGARVPTFQQMIDAVKGKAGIIPETKAPEVYGRHGLNMEKALMEVLKANKLDTPGANPNTPVVIQSFSAASLKALRKDYGCKLPLVYLIDAADTTADGLKAVKQFADGIAPNKTDVLARPEMVTDAHDLGMSVTVWTFRSEKNGKFKNARDEMRYFLRELRVDALFTDNPDQFPRD
jgi:glycerophosphoryl diester phosphodiesterase